MTLSELYSKADFVNKNGIIFNDDCMNILPEIGGNSISLTITDIPYNEVNRKSNGLRNLDKGNADVLTFDLEKFLSELYRITDGTIIIFCGMEQFSVIFNFFNQYSKQGKGTVRQLIWHKSNPSPMNGQNIYLSATENAVWFKKRGSTFNAHCKHNVFECI